MDKLEMSSLCCCPRTLAKQLTCIELRLIRGICRDDLLQGCKTNSSTSVSKNYSDYVHWCNRLSTLVDAQLTMCTNKPRRKKIMLTNYLLDVAVECISIGNFNSAIIILIRLDMSPVSKMQGLWAEHNWSYFNKMKHLIDPNKNFSNYRAYLQVAKDRTETDENVVDEIFIPYFELLMKDLYVADDVSSRSSKDSGDLTFQIEKSIHYLEIWKKAQCSFKEIPIIIKYLESDVILDRSCQVHLLQSESLTPCGSNSRSEQTSARLAEPIKWVRRKVDYLFSQ
ncbi:hypothetical protein CHS0354_039238 [Potamilus streckersoni]|uniref:Ras-GEF domain-containing protein n=1 Tax=Potamilus streckersoni TaxID=2493646 RepID=A0AAE0WBL5_9BIVA|nr:hypothetical protein CHS0354_039238 [Potamilus streckersoni]